MSWAVPEGSEQRVPTAALLCGYWVLGQTLGAEAEQPHSKLPILASACWGWEAGDGREEEHADASYWQVQGLGLGGLQGFSGMIMTMMMIIIIMLSNFLHVFISINQLLHY